MRIELTLKTRANVQCAPLGNDQKEVKVHLKSLNVGKRIFSNRVATAASKGRYSMNILIHKITNFTSNRTYKIITRDYYLELRLMDFSRHYESQFLTD